MIRMNRIKQRVPSPAMAVAGTALVVALAGTAIDGPLASKSALSKPEKKQVRKIAKQETDAATSKLTTDLRTASAFDQNIDDIASLSGFDTTVASATITTHSAGRILATGSAELVGAEGDEVGACSILLAGKDSADYESAPDDILQNNEITIAVSFAVERPPGTYTAALQCRSNTGTIGKDDAAINVYALGS